MPTNIKIYDGVKADKSAFTAKKFLFRCSSSVSVSFEGRRKRILSYFVRETSTVQMTLVGLTSKFAVN